MSASDMTEVKKQKAILRQEEGLPSLADLISLSQCLISPQLASAFSITSPSPHSAADAALASAFSSTSHAYPDLLGSPAAPQANPYPQPHAGDRACLGAEGPPGDSGAEEASHVNPHPKLHQGDRSLHVTNASERICNSHVQSDERYLAHFTPLGAKDRSNDGGVSVREWHGNSESAHAGHLRRYGGDTSVGKDHCSSAPLNCYGGVIVKPSERDEDGVGEGEDHVHANAAPCISDSSGVATQADVDGEAEETESAPPPAENPNEETTARTLKRPRLVWTPELHKRFVDAVSHLGVKTAVPKIIMQLMNVEGLTRENVASHLQKYRVYLKRMQGLSNEGPTSSDHLFASTAVPASLATAGRFHIGMPAHLQDISQVPFTPSHNPVSMGRGHVAGIMSGPLPAMDPTLSTFLQGLPSHRFMQGDLQDVQGFRQHHSTSLQHIPKK